jgi:hypothetical protein
MATGMRQTMQRPQTHHGLRALPEIILVGLVLAALAAGAYYISTQRTDFSPLTGGPPADLVAARDSLPRFEGQLDYQPGVYNGSDSIDTVYLSDADSQQVISFFQQQMVKDGWKQIDAPHPLINVNPKTAPSTSYEFKAANDSVTVTIIAADADKDLTGHSNKTTVHIERN